jgi:hypothetical protein
VQLRNGTKKRRRGREWEKRIEKKCYSVKNFVVKRDKRQKIKDQSALAQASHLIPSYYILGLTGY